MTVHETAQHIIDSGGAASNAILLERLQNLGLQPRVAGGLVESGVAGLTVETLETQLLSFVPENETIERWMLSWETRAFADGYPVPDLVTVSAAGPREALELAVQTWLDVTFPALRGLCDPNFEESDRQVELSSLTGDEFLKWKTFTGQQNFSGPGAAALRRHFEVNPDFFLVLNAITGFLSQKRPHFVKIFLRYQNGDPTFGCAIDGQKSLEAEAEMAAKLAGDGPDAQLFEPDGDVEFRVFFAMRATPGEPDAEMKQILAQRAERDRNAEKSKFRWPWKR